MRRSIIALAVCALCAATAVAEEQADSSKDMTDAVAIMKKVDAASKAVKSVEYDLAIEATGAMATQIPKFTGSAVLEGWKDGLPEKFRLDLDVKPPGPADAYKLAAGSDGKVRYLVDHAAKKVYEDEGIDVLGSRRGLLYFGLMVEFVHPTPFEHEIKAPKCELKGSEKVGDEDCYRIYVEYADDVNKSTWLVSKKDFLPRRRIDHATLPSGDKGDVAKTITRLELNPKIDEKSFKCVVPEGFKKIDGYAP